VSTGFSQLPPRLQRRYSVLFIWFLVWVYMLRRLIRQLRLRLLGLLEVPYEY